MDQKYYAVKSGRIPGIYKSWDDCKKQTDGFSSAIYKSFKTKEEAEAFLGSSTDTPPKKEEDNCHSEAIAYVDGSYDDSQKAFAYGIVIFNKAEADAIISDVLKIIDDTAKKIM